MAYIISTMENYLKLMLFFIILELFILIICKRDSRSMPPGFVWGVQVLAFFMTFLFVITGESEVFDLINYSDSLSLENQVNLIPFERAYQDRFGFIMNMIAFIPLGIMLPLLWQTFSKLYKTVAVGFCLSVVIEITQLFNIRATDVDDIVMNTFGTIIGYFLYLIFFKKHQRYFQLQNLNASNMVANSGHVFIVCIFLSSYLLRPIINHFL